jgi:putative DNA primase/helicase
LDQLARGIRNLLTKLKAEASGVLVWAVLGCLDWQRDGLAESQAVQDSVNSWKSEDDPYREFFEDECEFGPANSVPVADIWRAFSNWAEKNGIRYPSRTKLYERLRLLGCSKAVVRDARGTQTRVRTRIRLVSPVGGCVGLV